MELNVPTDIHAIQIYFILVLILPSLFVMKGKWGIKIKYCISLLNFQMVKFGISPFKLFVILSQRASLQRKGLIGFEIVGET